VPVDGERKIDRLIREGTVIPAPRPRVKRTLPKPVGRVSSRLLDPEARAALARVQRASRVGSRRIGIARERIEAFWATVEGVELTESLAVRAGELADGHGLRGCDAVHLASLEHVGDGGVLLVSADRDLIEAARAIGFATIPVP
jgi:uncharacterized protein